MSASVFRISTLYETHISTSICFIFTTWQVLCSFWSTAFYNISINFQNVWHTFVDILLPFFAIVVMSSSVSRKHLLERLEILTVKSFSPSCIYMIGERVYPMPRIGMMHVGRLVFSPLLLIGNRFSVSDMSIHDWSDSNGWRDAGFEGILRRCRNSNASMAVKLFVLKLGKKKAQSKLP